MPLTTQQQLQLADELQLPIYAGLTMEQAYARLHAATIPVEQTRPAEFSFEQLLEPISAESAAKVIALPTIGKLIDMVTAQDRVGVSLMVKAFAKAGAITLPEAGAALAILQATVTETVQQEVQPRIVEAWDWFALQERYGFRESQGPLPVPIAEGMPNVMDMADFAAAWEVIHGK